MKGTIPQKYNTPERQDNVNLKRRSSFRVSSTQRGNRSHDRECDYWDFPHCKDFEKDTNVKGLSIHPLTEEESVHQSKGPDERKVTVATVSIAHHRPKNTSGKALASRKFHEHPLENKGKPGASGTIHNAHETFSCAQTETSVKKDEHKILVSEFGRVGQTEVLHMHHRKSTVWNGEQEEL